MFCHILTDTSDTFEFWNWADMELDTEEPDVEFIWHTMEHWTGLQIARDDAEQLLVKDEANAGTLEVRNMSVARRNSQPTLTFPLDMHIFPTTLSFQLCRRIF